MAGIKIVDLPALGRDLISTDLLELSLAGGTGSRKITGQEIMNASKLSVGNTPIINGAVGQVLFQGTGNVLQESANLFWDNTNGRLGIGANSPTSKLFVRADGASGLTQPFRVETSASRLLLQTEDGGTTRIGGPTARLYVNVESGGIAHSLVVNGSVHFGGGIGNAGANFFDSGGTSSASRIIQYDGSGSPKNLITANGASYIQGGNVLINTTTDAGYKLDVNGTARVVAQNYYGTFSESGLIYSSDAVGTYASAGASLAFALRNGGGGSGRFIFTSPAKGATSLSTQYLTQLIATFNPTSGVSSYTMLELTPTINQTGGANGITRGLYIAPTLTSAFDFRAIETTAGNVIFNGGNVGIGTSSPATTLDVVGDARATSAIYLGAGTNAVGFYSPSANQLGAFTLGVERFRIFSTGNFAIGTLTDAGFKLDVNGTARIGSSLNVTSNIIVGSGAGVYAPFIAAGGPTAFNFGIATIYSASSASAAVVSGLRSTYIDAITWQQSSGTAEFASFSATPTLNTTGTYSGIVRGFYYNPTLTSMTGVTAHWAIHTTAGRVRFEGLPTSPTGLNAGDIYNDGGTLKIV